MKTYKVCMHGLIWLLVLLMGAPPGILAQGSGTSETPSATSEPSETLSKEELDQMLASIALYPDSLLVQILMAATYPLEVVQAARWTNQNKDLKGDSLDDALEKKDWDPSVKALVPFPTVLTMMSDNLEWTQKLGDAFLGQQEDVMDSVQRLRSKANEAGNLRTTQEQKVIIEKEIIRIEPVTQVVYVPTYNPVVIYGPWWYPAYPPVAIYPPGYVAARVATAAISFGIGVAWAASVHRVIHGHFNWHRREVNVYRNITINRVNVTNINREKWQHNSKHRRGVNYRDKVSRERFESSKPRPDRSRQDFRGFDRRPGSGDIGKLGTSSLGSGRPSFQKPESRPGAGRPEVSRPAGERPGRGEQGRGDKRPGLFGGSEGSSSDRASGIRGRSSREGSKPSTGTSGRGQGSGSRGAKSNRGQRR